MAEEVRITSADELREWLKDKPVEWARVIAVRAALRALPLVVGNEVQPFSADLHARWRLEVFRAALASIVAAESPTEDTKRAARHASISNTAKIYEAAVESYGTSYIVTYANHVKIEKDRDLYGKIISNPPEIDNGIILSEYEFNEDLFKFEIKRATAKYRDVFSDTYHNSYFNIYHATYLSAYIKTHRKVYYEFFGESLPELFSSIEPRMVALAADKAHAAATSKAHAAAREAAKSFTETDTAFEAAVALTEAVRIAVRVTAGDGDAANAAGTAAHLFVHPGHAAEYWEELTRDAIHLIDGIKPVKLLRGALWSEQSEAYRSVRAAWIRIAQNYRFMLYSFDPWTSWCDALLPLDSNATPYDYFGDELSQRIALQPDEWWNRDAKEVNADIAQLLKERDARVSATPTPDQPNTVGPEIRFFKLVGDDAPRFQPEWPARFPDLAISGISTLYDFASVQWPDTVSEDRFHTALEKLCALSGRRAVADYRYALEGPSRDFDPDFPDAPTLDEWPGSQAYANLSDVIEKINGTMRPNYHDDDVIIAVVDTGILGTRLEFQSPGKMAGGWAPPGDDPWRDDHGHGTMCAVIAAGTTAAGGRFQGVAPHAKLASCRVPSFADGQLVLIYEELLIPLAKKGKKIIASHSFGYGEKLHPKGPQRYRNFSGVIDHAANAGIHMVFSAGNVHRDVGGDANSCSPNSIWQFKGREDVLTVGTCDLDGRMWFYSSRGPGQTAEWFGPCTSPDKVPDGHAPKPDVVAPTPRNGLIAHGAHDRIMPWGWGSSGAAPQVAGLLALLLSIRNDLPRDELYGIVRETARELPGYGPNCQGHGMIDCHAAMERVLADM